MREDRRDTTWLPIAVRESVSRCLRSWRVCHLFKLDKPDVFPPCIKLGTLGDLLRACAEVAHLPLCFHGNIAANCAVSGLDGLRLERDQVPAAVIAGIGVPSCIVW